jgi:transcriptional regulator with XRE-family HTH domain
MEIAEELGITHQGVSYYLNDGAMTVYVPIVCATCQRRIATSRRPVRRAGPVLCLKCLEKLPGNTWGQRLQACRLVAGLTRRDLGRATGIGEGRLSSYEADRMVPHERTVARLVDALGPDLGKPPPRKPPPRKPLLHVESILAWADAHRACTGKWPTELSGPVVEAPSETWLGVDRALRQGFRGLAQARAGSLPQLLRKHGRG